MMHSTSVHSAATNHWIKYFTWPVQKRAVPIILAYFKTHISPAPNAFKGPQIVPNSWHIHPWCILLQYTPLQPIIGPNISHERCKNVPYQLYPHTSKLTSLQPQMLLRGHKSFQTLDIYTHDAFYFSTLPGNQSLDQIFHMNGAKTYHTNYTRILQNAHLSSPKCF